MELGNLLFGNSRGKYELPRDFVELKEWQNLLKKLDADSTYGYINEYKGNILPGENGGCIVKNNESVIYNGSLLSAINVSNDDLKFEISFDLTITLDNNISFTGTFNLALPAGDVINEDEPYIKIKDFSDVVFKRI